MPLDSKEGMSDAEIAEYLTRIAGQLRISKITVTRSIKTRAGDHFVAFSGGVTSVQDDGSGPGTDAELSVSDGEVLENGFTLREGMLAQILLAREVHLAVYKNAWAAGSIKKTVYEGTTAAIRQNFSQLVLGVIKGR